MKGLTWRRRVAGAVLCVAFCVPALVSTHESATADESGPLALLVDFGGPVTPVIAQHLDRVISEAPERGAQLLLVRLDTPGGSIELMDDIVQSFNESRVPIVVWVGPRSAQATSAGVFVTLAAHVAGMAPGTTIGAASPVAGNGADLPDTLKSKVVGVLSAKMENLAARRGPDAVAFGIEAVESARTITAEEALDLRVVDFLAEDIDAVLAEIDGKEVSFPDRVALIETANMRVEAAGLSVIEGILNTITNPTMAYLLLLLGLIGILWEAVVPGVGLPGIIGGISLIVGVYALGVLPVNYAGVGLILLAFLLFLLDVKTGAGGLVAIGGVISLFLGGLLLFESPYYSVSIGVLIATAIAAGVFFVFAGRMAVAIHKKKATTGLEGLVGAVGEVREDLDPDGLVAVQGETWRATAEDGPVARGTRVEVTVVDGLRIRVKRAE